MTALPLARGRALVSSLGRDMRPDRARWLAGVGLTIAAALAGLVLPFGVAYLVDGARGGGEPRLGTALLLTAGAVIASAVLSTLGSMAMNRAIHRGLARIRMRAVERALELPAEAVSGAAVRADLLSRIGDDLAVASRTASALLTPWVLALTTVSVTIGGLALLNPWLALAGLAAAPVYVLAIRWYLPRSAPLYRAEREASAERTGAFVALHDGAETIRAYAGHEAAADRVRGASDRARVAARTALWFSTAWGKWINFAEFAGLAAILAAGYALVGADAATIGQVSAATLFFHRLFNPIGVIVMSFDDMQVAAAALSRVLGVPEADAAREVGGAKLLPGLVELRDVGHRYDGTSVLDGISLTIEPGQHAVLIGRSGSGKSTLASIIAGARRPARGAALIDGEEADDRREGASLVYVPQRSHLFRGTVADNLRLASSDADAASMARALERTGAGWVMEHPLGLDQVVDHRLRSDPVRRAQLVLAQTALANPRLLIADEITAGLGRRQAEIVENAFAGIAASATTVSVAHRLSQVRLADRVLVLDSGRVVEDGSHERLLADGGPYARFWRAWESAHTGDSSEESR